jgi:hypothetical protein
MKTSNENTTNRVNQNEQNFQQNISFTEDLDNSLNNFIGKSYLKAIQMKLNHLNNTICKSINFKKEAFKNHSLCVVIRDL